MQRSAKTGVRSMRLPDDDGALVGLFAACGAVLGGITGLVIGLFVRPATAAFAAVEIGLPGAVAGVVIGGLVAAGRVVLRARH